MIVLVPVFAGLLWLVLRGGRTYAVHLVFALHFHAWFFLISTLLLGLIVVPSKWVWPKATGRLPGLAHVAAPVYLALGIARFYEVGPASRESRGTSWPVTLRSRAGSRAAGRARVRSAERRRQGVGDRVRGGPSFCDPPSATVEASLTHRPQRAGATVARPAPASVR